VVLARPRDPHRDPVTLEEDDDVTEDYLERAGLEVPAGDTTAANNAANNAVATAGSLSTSTLQRSLSARVRRRERVGAQHFKLFCLTSLV